MRDIRRKHSLGISLEMKQETFFNSLIRKETVNIFWQSHKEVNSQNSLAMSQAREIELVNKNN